MGHIAELQKKREQSKTGVQKRKKTERKPNKME